MKNLAVIITNVCNLNCVFCLRKKDNAFIDLDLVKDVLRQAKSLGYDTIALTGGEACLYPLFYELVDFIAMENLYFTVVTNGVFYDKYIPLLKYAAKFSCFSISLDSYKAEVHDLLRGKDVFSKATTAIKYFVDKNIPVGISMCLNKFNYRDIEGLVNFAEGSGVKLIRILNTIKTADNDDFMLSASEWGECLKTLSRLKKEKLIPIIVYNSFDGCNEINFCDGVINPNVCVNPHGDLIFCCDTIDNGAVIGSLKQHTLAELISDANKIAYYLKLKRQEHYKKNEFFPGFNTCAFCNRYLEGFHPNALSHK